MKYLITGLGNIGQEYQFTRHNIGFEVVDYIAQAKGKDFELSTQSYVCKIKHKGRSVVLLKPTTYMNLSGKAVRYWMQKEQIPLSRSLVIVDEVALPFGKIRLRGKGSAGGHNGLHHIEQTLGTSKYPRLRFGIGNDFPKGRQVEYVLGQWTEEQIEDLQAAIPKAAEAALSFVSIGLQFTMNTYN